MLVQFFHIQLKLYCLYGLRLVSWAPTDAMPVAFRRMDVKFIFRMQTADTNAPFKFSLRELGAWGAEHISDTDLLLICTALGMSNGDARAKSYLMNSPAMHALSSYSHEKRIPLYCELIITIIESECECKIKTPIYHPIFIWIFRCVFRKVQKFCVSFLMQLAN